jgi:hypothetical protein
MLLLPHSIVSFGLPTKYVSKVTERAKAALDIFHLVPRKTKYVNENIDEEPKPSPKKNLYFARPPNTSRG